MDFKCNKCGSDLSTDGRCHACEFAFIACENPSNLSKQLTDETKEKILQKPTSVDVAEFLKLMDPWFRFHSLSPADRDLITKVSDWLKWHFNLSEPSEK